jgi:predicted  nucleic acid-binding Zn-ribbon protein
MKTSICAISLETIKEPHKLKCGHVFEKAKIDKWFESNNTCPVCRNKEFENLPYRMPNEEYLPRYNDRILETSDSFTITIPLSSLDIIQQMGGILSIEIIENPHREILPTQFFDILNLFNRRRIDRVANMKHEKASWKDKPKQRNYGRKQICARKK